METSIAKQVQTQANSMEMAIKLARKRRPRETLIGHEHIFVFADHSVMRADVKRSSWRALYG
jgi:hypothetical protein